MRIAVAVIDHHRIRRTQAALIRVIHRQLLAPLLRIADIGCKRRGRIHLQVLLEQPVIIRPVVLMDARQNIAAFPTALFRLIQRIQGIGRNIRTRFQVQIETRQNVLVLSMKSLPCLINRVALGQTTLVIVLCNQVIQRRQKEHVQRIIRHHTQLVVPLLHCDRARQRIVPDSHLHKFRMLHRVGERVQRMDIQLFGSRHATRHHHQGYDPKKEEPFHKHFNFALQNYNKFFKYTRF